MGKSGGYKKKTVMTGTEKKQKKLAAKEYRQAAPARQEAMKYQQSLMSGNDPLSQQIRDLMTGTQGYDQAKQVFQPIQAEAERQFQQSVLPGVMNQFGRTSKTSSALNQALASAGQDLSTRLGAQFAGLYSDERARQLQAMQNQQQFQGQQAQLLTNAGLPAANIAYAKDQYALLPKGPSNLQKFGSVALPIAGAAGGALLGGPAGAKIGATVGSAASQSLSS